MRKNCSPPFAKWRTIELHMARLKRDSKAILRTLARSKERSPLFWWMVDDHDSILALSGKRIHWPTVCAEATRRGKTDTEGNAPSLANAKKTWQRARKYVAETRAANAAKPPPAVYPSRISKNWRPSNAPPPETQSGPQSSVRGTPAPPQNNLMPIRKSVSQEVERFDPKKQIERLRKLMAERSGRKFSE
jgi:hypothetical protein